jgi:hypothetical protein
VIITSFAKSYARLRSTERMVDACTIVRPGEARLDYDPATRKVVNSAGTTVYTGPCRIWEIPAGSLQIVGDEEYYMSSMYLSLPYDAPLCQPEDQVQVTGCEDTSLIGRALKVTSILRAGGLRASRLLQVQFIDSFKEEW